jgi:hypothetical protein
MVNMGVGQNDVINTLAITEAASIEFKGLFTFALKHSAVKKYTLPINLDKVLGACNGFCRAMKSKPH